MGRYPVHIPPCPSQGSMQAVSYRHTRNGADDGNRTRGLDLGKVARYQLRHIRESARRLPASTGGKSCGMLLTIDTVAGGAARSLRCLKPDGQKSPTLRCPPRGAVFASGRPSGKKKARIRWESGPLMREIEGAARLRAPPARMHRILITSNQLERHEALGRMRQESEIASRGGSAHPPAPARHGSDAG
jgi:hypothetical protein